jgi:hypothetical protein
MSIILLVLMMGISVMMMVLLLRLFSVTSITS